jgi:beta-glucosidase
MKKIYQDSNQSIQARIENLMEEMTVKEKVGQISQVFASLDRINIVREQAQKGEIGSRILASNGLAGTAEQHIADLKEGNEVQEIAVEDSRLGIPLINGRDIIHGHRTIFPIPLAQAASWEPELVEEAARISALEASAYGVHWTFAPMLDIARDPRWGRIIEGFGEDPYLCGILAQASVKGYQGDNLSEPGRIAACAKHFIAYGGAEGGRDYNTSECSDNTLRNTYLPPFKAAIEAGVSTVMSGFHELGGEPVSGSRYLLTELLKEELGFDGYVISDWASVDFLKAHGVAANDKEAAYRAFDAGVDMDMADFCFMNHIKELIDEGKISEERLDDAVKRILKVKFELGLFEDPYTDPDAHQEIYLLPEYIETARELAAKSMVLLKNQNDILPLSKENDKIAVLGPLADAKRELMGSWVMDGKEKDVVSIIEGVKSIYEEENLITSTKQLDEMLIAARKADIVVVALGESHLRTGESANVADIKLPFGQNELIKSLSKLGKPIVAVVCAGRPLAITELEEHADAILYAWHPGIQGGRAVADILFGAVNPGGKLPVTFPRTTGQIPIYYNHKMNGKGFDEYYDIDSRPHYYDISGKPLYPFGFGLSYTEFEYDQIEVDQTEINPDETVKVSARVTNTGEYAGEETVQCYLRDCVAAVTRPLRELKAFQKLYLEPGQSRIVEFILGKEELSYYNRSGEFVLEPGEFKVWIGGDCLTDLEVKISVKKLG